MKNRVRLSYVDTAKFIAIFFIMIGHSNLNTSLSHFLFSFHVPLFFVLYGLVFEPKTNLSWGGQFNGLFFKVIVPYFLYSFILGEGIGPKSIACFSYGSIQTIGQVLPNQHLWFLPCYFVAVLLVWVFERFNERKSLFYSLMIAILCGFLSYLLDYSHDVKIVMTQKVIHLTGMPNDPSALANDLYVGFPFSLNVSLSAVVFIYLGYLLKSFINKVAESNNTIRKVAYGVVFLFIGYLLYMCNSEANESFMKMVVMSYALYGNYILFISTAACLSLGIIFICMTIDNKIMAKYGQYTLFIFAFHFCAMAIPRMIIQLVVDNQYLSAHPIIFSIFQASAGLILLCLIIPSALRWVPNLFGKKLNIKE